MMFSPFFLLSSAKVLSVNAKNLSALKMSRKAECSVSPSHLPKHYTLQDLAPSQTMSGLLVAGLHRASPSATLDKIRYISDMFYRFTLFKHECIVARDIFKCQQYNTLFIILTEFL
jgi:hypothetical protein